MNNFFQSSIIKYDLKVKIRIYALLDPHSARPIVVNVSVDQQP